MRDLMDCVVKNTSGDTEIEKFNRRDQLGEVVLRLGRKGDLVREGCVEGQGEIAANVWIVGLVDGTGRKSRKVATDSTMFMEPGAEFVLKSGPVK